jgi:uncharacterized protein YbcI
MAVPPESGRSPADIAHAGPSPILANISRRIVQLHKEFYGKGPTKAKTYYYDDLVVVLMRGGFTTVEETLHQSGHGDSVRQQRSHFQQVMFEPFKKVIEDETGRKVIAFMSTSHQHPDLLGEMFVLETAEVLADEPSVD